MSRLIKMLFVTITLSGFPPAAHGYTSLPEAWLICDSKIDMPPKPEPNVPFRVTFTFVPQCELYHLKGIPDTAFIYHSQCLTYLSGDTLWTGYLNRNEPLVLAAEFVLKYKCNFRIDGHLIAQEALCPDGEQSAGSNIPRRSVGGKSSGLILMVPIPKPVAVPDNITVDREPPSSQKTAYSNKEKDKSPHGMPFVVECNLDADTIQQLNEPFEVVFHFRAASLPDENTGIPDTAIMHADRGMNFVNGDTLWSGFLELGRSYKIIAKFISDTCTKASVHGILWRQQFKPSSHLMIQIPKTGVRMQFGDNKTIYYKDAAEKGLSDCTPQNTGVQIRRIILPDSLRMLRDDKGDPIRVESSGVRIY
ncbi:MAG: hypothetical protein NT002_13720 [candidate division Zixibacteria bacterium]|nr:hypothetical protein [candidate division Zixibacteria bacterium]